MADKDGQLQVEPNKWTAWTIPGPSAKVYEIVTFYADCLIRMDDGSLFAHNLGDEPAPDPRDVIIGDQVAYFAPGVCRMALRVESIIGAPDRTRDSGSDK